MKNSFKILIIFGFCLLAAPARGASPKFGFVSPEGNLPVPEQELKKWQKPTQVFKTSQAFYKLPKLEELLLNFAEKDQKSEILWLDYDPGAIYQYLKTEGKKLEKETKEPVLEIDTSGLWATKFEPPQNGLQLQIRESTDSALDSLVKKAPAAELSLKISQPKKQLSQLNSLGIDQLVARGESRFAGSPKNRRHNIRVGVSKFAGIIVPQGAVFSFNKWLGPVEKEQGFLPELVIKKDGTQPELGGGLCQVSSTTFRAAMKAGLPILQRKNHSYAVQYYSPQGTDATIYPGVVDLKFVNDTPGALLVWPYFQGNDILVFDFYGSPDNRLVTLYTPQQYEKKLDGSMKALWVREVTKNGITKKDEFKSVYLPPSLFHKEEKFVTAASSTALNTTTIP